MAVEKALSSFQRDEGNVWSSVLELRKGRAFLDTSFGASCIPLSTEENHGGLQL